MSLEGAFLHRLSEICLKHQKLHLALRSDIVPIHTGLLIKKKEVKLYYKHIYHIKIDPLRFLNFYSGLGFLISIFKICT